MFPTRRMVVPSVGLLVFATTVARPALAQSTTTYHLHAANSNEFCCRALTTAGPAPSGTALQTGDLKNQTGSAFQWAFETLAGTGLGGTIPSGATLTFSLWVKKTANFGAISPQAKLLVNNTYTLCTATGGALGTAPSSPVVFSCTLGSAVPQTTSDLLRLWVGYSITTSTSHSVKVELDIDGSTDSTTQVPNPVPPHINSLSPTTAPANLNVVISGTNFGLTQGTVQFTAGATVTASVSAWGDTSITAAVPTGLTPGSATVKVIVGGASSNAAAFTVIPPPTLTSISPTSGHRGDSVTFTGANFLGTQAEGSSTVTFYNGATAAVTSWNDTSITAIVPSTATTGSVAVQVSGQNSNGITYTVIIPGTVAGTITQNSSGNPLSGATVQAVYQGVIKATGTTPSNGSYSLSGLDPGTYDLRVYATNYSPEVRSVAITSSSTTTVNVAMSQPGAIAGTVTQSDGITAIAGAAVTVFSGPIQTGTANTDSLGAYSIANLHPGTFTVQAVNVGNRTKEQSAVVNENATTTANLSLDPQPPGPVLYAYDAIGRLVQVTDPSGDSAIYRYDPVGNVTSIARTGTTVVSISGFTPTSGAVGSTVTITGTGFSTTPNQNTVSFVCAGQNCTVSGTVTSASANQLVVTVPGSAVSGVMAVTAQNQTANAPSSFTVITGGAAPTISSFTPTLVVAGNTLAITGTNFDSTPANDVVTANLASAQVSSANSTSVQVTVPVTTTGHVSVMTQNGTATSTDYLWVAPSPYAITDVDSTGPIAIGTDTPIQVNTGKIAIRAFDGTQGHRAAVSLVNGTFSGGGSLILYGPYGNSTTTGFLTNGFLEPVDLRATSTYTFLLAPSGPPYAGSATVHVYDVPADQTGPIPVGGSAPVSLSVGQNARLSFTGAANDRVCAATTNPAPPAPVIASGTLTLLTPLGTPLGSTGFNSAVPAFLDATALPSSGTYTVLIDPDTTSAGQATAFLYSVPQDFSGTLTLNGSSAPIPLSPCQNGSLTFSGATNGSVTVHVTGNTFATVTVTLFDGTTQLSRFTSSAASFDLAPASGSGNYTIKIDPDKTASGTLNISVSGS